MAINFPNSVYRQVTESDEAWNCNRYGRFAKVIYMAAYHISRGEPVDIHMINEEIAPGRDLPEVATIAKIEDIATMPCRQLAELLIDIDVLNASGDGNAVSFDCFASELHSERAVQTVGIIDFVVALSEHGLPNVSVPLLPLLQLAYELLTHEESMAQRRKPSEERGVTDEQVVGALAAYYSSFDQRFQAIFYPATRAKTEMLVCAAYEDLSSALWAHAQSVGLPEVQNVSWCWNVLASGHVRSPIVDALKQCNVQTKAALSATDIEFPSLTSPDMTPSILMACDDRPAVSVMEFEQSSPALFSGLLSAEDVCPYPELTIPSDMNPAIDLQLMVIETIPSQRSVSVPVNTMSAANAMLEYAEQTLDGSQAKSEEGASPADMREAIKTLKDLIARVRKATLMRVSDLPHGQVFIHDTRLQFVLVQMLSLGNADQWAGKSNIVSLRQLEALLNGYDQKRLLKAIHADFELPDDLDVRETIDRLMEGLTDIDLGREAVMYGTKRYDIIRITLSAMSTIFCPSTKSADSKSVTRLTPLGLLSMLVEAPSAFNESYGRMTGKRAFALMSREGGDLSPHPVWSGIRFFGFPVSLITRTRNTESRGVDDLMAKIRQSLPNAQGNICDCGLGIAQTVANMYGGENITMADEVPVTVYLSALDKLLHSDEDLSFAGVVSARKGRYEVSSLVFRVADALIHRGAHIEGEDQDNRNDANLCFALALGAIATACKMDDKSVTLGSSDDDQTGVSSGRGGLIENASYPQMWYDTTRLSATLSHQQASHPLSGGGHRMSTRTRRRASDTPNLNQLGDDMTEIAAEGGTSTVVERDEELQQIISVLLRREKANVMILGEAGVGKSALVELLASAIAKAEVPQKLVAKRLIRIDVMTLVSCGEMILQTIFEEAKRSGAILFIDEFHAMSQQAMNALKPYLARADISLIGATTNAEYQSTILKDKALARRFSTVRLRELSQEQAVICLKARVQEYEQWHGVAYDTKVPYAAAIAAATYMTNRHTPDRELDVMDTAGSIAAMAGRTVVVEDDAYAAVRQLTGNRSVLSMSEVAESMHSDEGELENRRNETFGDMVGQDAAKDLVVETLAMGQIGLGSSDSPRNVMMFVGPSGVGKTMMAERIPKFLGLGADAVLPISMSEFARGHEYSRLVGSPVGYIGYEQGGILTNFAMAHPDGVVIFDEIEKAAQKVRQILLNLFDRGYIDAAAGEHVDCRSMTFICTSNVGFDARLSRPIGFVHDEDGRSYQQRVDNCRETLIKELGAPFVGRIDQIVVFDELTADDLKEAVRLEYRKMAEAYMGKAGIDVSEFYPESMLDDLLSSISEKEISEIGARSVAKRVESEIKRRFVSQRGHVGTTE